MIFYYLAREWVKCPTCLISPLEAKSLHDIWPSWKFGKVWLNEPGWPPDMLDWLALPALRRFRHITCNRTRLGNPANQASNRTAGNTLLYMRTSSNISVNMAVLRWFGLSDSGVKVTLVIISEPARFMYSIGPGVRIIDHPRKLHGVMAWLQSNIVSGSQTWS